jgi:hypothetical protein
MYNSPVCYKHRAREEEVWWATVDGENGYDSENRSPIEKLLTQEWFADIVEHKIKVTLQRYGSFVAKLYIDEELRDDNRLELSKVKAQGEIWLSTVMADTMDKIEVRFRTDFGGIKAKILLNGEHIGGDIFENSPHSDRVDSSSPEVWRPGLLRKMMTVLLGYVILNVIIGIWWIWTDPCVMWCDANLP